MPVLVLPPKYARRILLTAITIQLVLFLIEARGLVGALANSRTANRPQVVGAFVRVIDGHGYYAWLRSMLIDGDWQFENEFDFYRAHWNGGESLRGRTPTGATPNQWSVGPALVWAAGVIPVHLIATACGWEQEEPVGYGPAYQLAVGGVTLALSVATLLFTYGAARRFAPPEAAAAAAAVIVLGTSLVAYGSAEVAMAHGPAAAALAAFLFVWLKTEGGISTRRWFVLGLLLGITCLMRWQLATFAVVPAAEAVGLMVAAGWRRAPVLFLRLMATAGLGALIGFAPQITAWWVVYGAPLHNPHPTHPDWLAPSFWRVLGSTDRSLFFWTPVTLLAVFGYGVAVRSSAPRYGAARMLFLGAAVQIYLLAAVCDRGVFLGWSFGFRMLTETCVVLVVGLAAWFDRAGLRRPTLLASVSSGLVLWNLILLGLYRHGILPPEGSGPAVLVRAAAQYLHWRPLEAVISVAMALGLLRVLTAGFQRPAPVAARALDSVELPGVRRAA